MAWDVIPGAGIALDPGIWPVFVSGVVTVLSCRLGLSYPPKPIRL